MVPNMISKPTADRLKSVDPDRYRAAMLAKLDVRSHLHMIYAFHYELAKVPELVSEPMIGQIRYQWWRDAVAEIYSNGPVRQHEITTPLSEICRTRQVPRFWLDRLIDGRERDLDPTPFKDIDAARTYCRHTSGVLMQIAVKVLGGEGSDGVIAAGEAWGLTGLARAWRYYNKTMLRELDYEGLCAAAQASYERARKDLIPLSVQTLPALAYTGLVPKYLTRLKRSSHDATTMSVSFSPLAKNLHLIGVAMTGRI